MMHRYLAGVGGTVTLDVKQIVLDSDPTGANAAKAHWDNFVNIVIGLVDEREFVGTINIVETKAHLGTTEGSKWIAAVGEYTGWGSAEVTGSIDEDGDINYSVKLRYDIWDPYDWDPTRSYPQGDLAKLHLEGLAKQFMMEGNHEKTITWVKGSAPPSPPAP
jgi:hypothetical protein